MPRYVFILQTIDEFAGLDGDALATAIGHLGPLGKRRADRDTWIGECEAASEADARRFVQARVAQLPRYVPRLRIVDLHD